MSDMTGLDSVLANLGRVEAAIREGAASAAQEIADELAEYAHANHMWTSRSGDTEESTKAVIAEETLEYVLVTLSAGMSYDSLLERAHSGRWAWLWPAIEAKRPKVLTILRDHVRLKLDELTGGL